MNRRNFIASLLLTPLIRGVSRAGIVYHHEEPAVKAKAQHVAAYPSYPLRPPSASIHFRHTTHAGAVSHLLSGEHAGKFDPDWLATRSMAELDAIHQDDHGDRVHWASVVRQYPVARAQVQIQFTQPYYSAGQCANGNCASPGLFRRRR